MNICMRYASRVTLNYFPSASNALRGCAFFANDLVTSSVFVFVKFSFISKVLARLLGVLGIELSFFFSNLTAEETVILLFKSVPWHSFLGDSDFSEKKEDGGRTISLFFHVNRVRINAQRV